jgi:hypothetical protein
MQEQDTAEPPGVPIGRDAESGDEVILPQDERVLGAAIIGKPGTGKSSILEHLILADLEDGTPGMVIDPHGRLVHRIISAASEEQAQRIILLEVTPDAPFGLNLLALRKPVNENDDVVTWAVDTVVETLKKLYSEDDVFAPRLERYLRLAARTLIWAGGTLIDIPRLFEDDGFRAWCLDKVRNASETQSLRQRWAAYERLRPVDRVLQTESLMNRIDGIIDSPLMSAIVGSEKTTVPFDQILSGESMLLVSLPSETLGRERCDFMGAMLLCELANRVFSRAVAQTTPPRLHLYLDEYQRFATSTTADFLEEGRKYNVGVVLAHQTLYQITDQRIRNASRHAGALLALSLTRPDAEQLAGEFPVEARQEWIETIEEVDGTKPKYVFSPTPAEDIYLKGHSDPQIDRIAEIFFAYTPRWTKELMMSALEIEHRNQDILTFFGDHRKSAGVASRSGSEDGDSRVKVPAYDVNGLLLDAMAGKLQDKEALLEKLLVTETWKPQFQLKVPELPDAEPVTVLRGVSTMYYSLVNASKSMIEQPVCHCPPLDLHAEKIAQGHRLYRPSRPQTTNDPIGIHLPGCPAKAKPHLTKDEEQINANVRAIYESEAQWYVQNAIRSWLSVYLQDIPALIRNEYTSAMRDADEKWVNTALRNCWDYEWRWYGRIEYVEDKSGVRAVLNDFAATKAEFEKHRDEYLSMFACARLRLQFLVWLCEGLYKSPVMVASGEHQPNMRTRQIVHQPQSQQDALNEFMAELVHPSEPYVAHIRMPQRYHQTRLRAPVAVNVNPERITAVRERSQQQYRITDDPENGAGAPSTPSSSPPSGPVPDLKRIGRRPRPQAPDQQTLPYPRDPEP